MPSATLGDYLKRVGGSVGVLSALGAALPLASLAPTDWAAFLFPPLGDLTPFAKIACIVAVLLIICCCYIGVGVDNKWLKKAIVVAAMLALVSASYYVYYSLQYVLKINTPSTFILVSTGSERTAFANRTFAQDESRWTMVKSRGLDDEQITTIWTPISVLHNRLQLFFTYCTTLLLWALIFALSTALEINLGGTSATTP